MIELNNEHLGKLSLKPNVYYDANKLTYFNIWE